MNQCGSMSNNLAHYLDVGVVVCLIAHPHLLVRAINEGFLSTGGTFRVGLANESHWLKLVLILTVH
jgi:hypothetical protein